MTESMIEAFFLAYGVLIVAGSWVMLKAIAEAPLGYQDEDGFHYLPTVAEPELGAIEPPARVAERSQPAKV